MPLSLRISISEAITARDRRRRPTRRHDAGSLGREVVVAYPFHPLFGKPAIVVADQMHGGVRHLTLRPEGGESFLVPEWMTQADAAAAKVVEVPCISVVQLRALRAFLDSILASSSGKAVPGKGGANGDTLDPAAKGSFRTLAAGEPTHGDRAAKGAGFIAGAVGRGDEPAREKATRTRRRRAMTKISPDHLARSAVVYVRQSTAEQVAHNLESQRRQYGLADRARLLGWQDVEVIDDDLGRSAGGVRRPGFERLLAAICEGRVGAVMSVEASRLARNGRDWHTLLEFCGLVGTIIVDEDGIYDPASTNDRLLLGMKGTMSEMELSVFRQRSIEAMKQKARRGELFLTVAVGYVKAGATDREGCRSARPGGDGLVFRKFSELQSIRQVLVWFRQEKIPLPVLRVGEAADRIVWKAPVYSTMHHMLTNPVYAGAYAFGRRTMRVVIENGRKQVMRSMQRDWRSWGILIPDHHESYIAWAEFERNQSLIADNANGKRFMSRGAVRPGEALLVGLFRCARCGRKLHVRYSDGAFRYECVGAFNHLAAARCISFGGMRVDRVVAKEVLDRLQPLGVEAALAAIEARSHRRSEKQGQLEFALQQARYEAVRAQRQYDAADPDNRLVAGELERRWNERLVVVRDLEVEIDQASAEQADALPCRSRPPYDAGPRSGQAWDSPGATPETRKKIIRTVISEIIVDVVGDNLELVIHWQGGDHTRLSVKKNKVGQTRWVTEADIVDLVRALARQMPDDAIATVLNRSGKATSHGNSWTRGSVCSLRHQNDIAIHRPGERAERGEATINEAAAILDVSTTTVRRLIAERAFSASQPCKGAPWIIPHAELARETVRREANARRSRRPPSDDRQKNLLEI